MLGDSVLEERLVADDERDDLWMTTSRWLDLPTCSKSVNASEVTVSNTETETRYSFFLVNSELRLRAHSA